MGKRSGPDFSVHIRSQSRGRGPVGSMVDLGMGPDDSGAKDVAFLQSAPKSFEKLQFSLTGLDELGVSGQHELVKI